MRSATMISFFNKFDNHIICSSIEGRHLIKLDNVSSTFYESGALLGWTLSILVDRLKQNEITWQQSNGKTSI